MLFMNLHSTLSLIAHIFSHAGNESEQCSRRYTTSHPIRFPRTQVLHLYSAAELVIRTFHTMFRRKFPKHLQMMACFHHGRVFLLLGLLQVLYTDFSVSPRTGLWHWQGLMSAPPYTLTCLRLAFSTSFLLCEPLTFIPLSTIISAPVILFGSKPSPLMSPLRGTPRSQVSLTRLRTNTYCLGMAIKTNLHRGIKTYLFVKVLLLVSLVLLLI